MHKLLCSILYWVEKYIYDTVNNNVPLQTVALNFRPTCFQSIMPIPVSAEWRKTGNAAGAIMGNYNINQKFVVILKAGLHYRPSNWKNSCFKGQHNNSYLCEWYDLWNESSCIRCVLYQIKLMSTALSWGHAVAQLVEALRYKPEVRGFDSRWCH